MDAGLLWGVFSGVISILLVLGGKLHYNLTRRIEVMDQHLSKTLTSDQVRLIIEDKMAPQTVEAKALAQRIDELRISYRDLSTKIDKILAICSRLDNDDKR